MTDASTSHTTPATQATASTSAAAPQTATAPQTAATSPETVPETQARSPPVEEHKKHGIAGVIEKIIHPIHGSSHTHSGDAVSVPVAVPENPSDGQAHLAPGGSAVGGIL